MVSKFSYRRLFRSLGYILLFSGIILTTIILVTIGRGYRIDFKSGQIYSGGLLLIDSIPPNATITIDGQPYKNTSPTQIPLRTGNYVVGITKTGFRPWQKTVTIISSQITWLRYPYLVPRFNPVEHIENVKDFRFWQASNDRRQVAIASSGSHPQITVMAIGGSTSLVYRMPTGLADSHFVISHLLWAPDGKTLLLQISHGQTRRFLLVSLTGRPVVDLTSTFKTNFELLLFNDQDANELFGLIAGSLKRVDLASQSLSGNLANNVSGLAAESGQPWFIQNSNGHSILKTVNRDGQNRILKTSLAAASYTMAFLDFGSQRYLALLSQTSHRVILYNIPSTGVAQTVLSGPLATNLLPSPDNQFLLMQNRSDITVYDLDKQLTYRSRLTGLPSAPLAWFDNFHFLSATNRGISLIDYDGTNQTLVNSAFTKQVPVVSLNQKQILYAKPLVNSTSDLRAINLNID